MRCKRAVRSASASVAVSADVAANCSKRRRLYLFFNAGQNAIELAHTHVRTCIHRDTLSHTHACTHTRTHTHSQTEGELGILAAGADVAAKCIMHKLLPAFSRGESRESRLI